MKFTIQTKDLKQVLAPLHKIIDKSAPLPILRTILIEADQAGRIKLTANSFNWGIAAFYVDATVEEEGVAALDAASFYKIVKSIDTKKEATLSFSLDVPTQRMTMKGSQLTIATPGDLGVADFPTLRFEEEELCGSFSTTAQVLHDFLKLGSGAADKSSDSNRPMLASVNLSQKEDHLYAASADGFRLSVAALSLASFDGQLGDASLTISIRSLDTILKLLSAGDGEEQVCAYFSNLRVKISTIYGEVVTHRRDGRFPDFHALIPKNPTNRLTVNRQVLLSAIKTVAPFTNSVGTLKIAPREDSIDVSAEDAGSIAVVSVVCDADCDDDDIFGINWRYLQGALSRFDTEEVYIAYSFEAPILIAASAGDGLNCEVVMPQSLPTNT